MNDAYCRMDGISYTANRFASMSAGDIVVKRNALTCVECEAKAFFRKESVDGKSACFGVLGNHDPGCEYYADEVTSSHGGGVGGRLSDSEEAEAILSIDFSSSYTKPLPTDYGIVDKQSGRSRGSSKAGSGSEHREHKWKLSTLLRSLILDDEYGKSGMKVCTSNGNVDIAKFCLSFSDFSKEKILPEYVCWGRIIGTYYNDDKKQLFLNSSLDDSVNIGVSGELVDVISQVAKLDNTYRASQEFYIILHSTEQAPYYSNKKGKWTLWLNDLKRYAISTNKKLL